MLVQIESRAGLKNLDAICAIEGVDGIFIGPSELSAALGNLGNPVDAEVQAAMQEIFACARPHGRAVSIFALEGVRCSPLPGTGRSVKN
jgi:2-keto-3-deoxy-L-rhamnonate aldolase RhmA